ncbi:MAG: hypothetical protein GMKNLPBB_02871 [Myxococcota bacterium]|nr:hypothetical protein [Myxococcota bacterium]
MSQAGRASAAFRRMEINPAPWKGLMAVAAIGLLAGCSGATVDWARKQNTTSAYRRVLIETSDEFERKEAEKLLIALEIQQARKANTISGWKRYLALYPKSPYEDEARAAVESIRYQRTREKPGRASYSHYLLKHPDGKHAQEVRGKLAALEADEAIKNGSRAALSAFVMNYPDHSRTPEIREKLAEQEYAEVSGSANPIHYIRFASKHPGTRFAALARQELTRLRFRRLSGSPWMLELQRAVAGTGLEEDQSQTLEERANALSALSNRLKEWKRFPWDAPAATAAARLVPGAATQTAAMEPRERLAWAAHPAIETWIEQGFSAAFPGERRAAWEAARLLSAPHYAASALYAAGSDADDGVRLLALEYLEWLSQRDRPRFDDAIALAISPSGLFALPRNAVIASYLFSGAHEKAWEEVFVNMYSQNDDLAFQHLRIRAAAGTLRCVELDPALTRITRRMDELWTARLPPERLANWDAGREPLDAQLLEAVRGSLMITARSADVIGQIWSTPGHCKDKLVNMEALSSLRAQLAARNGIIDRYQQKLEPAGRNLQISQWLDIARELKSAPGLLGLPDAWRPANGLDYALTVLAALKWPDTPAGVRAGHLVRDTPPPPDSGYWATPPGKDPSPATGSGVAAPR